MNDTGDVYTPEMKVKHFLDSLGYYMLLGSTGGIETPYKSVMHAKREIPVSSCPGEIDNIFYASGGSTEMYAEEEAAMFKNILEQLDAKASQYEAKKPHKRQKSLFSKKLKKNMLEKLKYILD